MNVNKILFFVFTIMLISLTFAKPIPESSMKLFAVTPEGKGTTATLSVEIHDGEGEIWSKIGSLVGISTQSTEKTVITLAKNYSKDVNEYDYKFDIISDAQIVDGPSAGLPMGLLLISMVQGNKLPKYVSATGTISSTGTIGKVGGILEKTKEASENDIKLFLIPKSELEVVVKDGDVKKVNLSEYAYSQWGIKVVGVDTIDEALEIISLDLDDINVSSENQDNELIYDPPALETNENLSQLRNFTENYLIDTKNSLDTAMQSLNKTELEDNDILNSLYETITTSQKYLEDGNTALEKNYLYSAANYLFLANIYANLVNDVATNPELLESGVALTAKIKTLKNELSTYKKDLNFTPYNGTEWNIAAKERLLWAEKYTDEINSVNVIINGSSIDTKSINLGKLEKYEFAKEWIRISKNFNSYVPKSNKILDITPYEKSASEINKELTKAETVIQTYEIQDIDRRIYGANKAYDNGWYLTSIYESASTLAIVNSTLEINEKDYFTIKSLVENKSNDVKEKIKNKDLIWATLYYDHSNYFYNAAEFYEQNNRLSDATDNMKSAYQLLYMADNLAEAILDIESNKKMLITSNNIVTKTTDTTIEKKNIDYDLLKKILIVLLLALIVAAIIIIVLYKKFRHTTVYDSALSFTNYQIYKLKEMMIDIDKKFMTGKIDSDTYKMLCDKYHLELIDLENKKGKLTEIMADMESLESEIKYLKNKLDTNNSLFKKGLISEQEYKRRINLYKKEISDLTYELQTDEDKIMKTIEKKLNVTEDKKESEKPKRKLKKNVIKTDNDL